jgi:hypothetical protein
MNSIVDQFSVTALARSHVRQAPGTRSRIDEAASLVTQKPEYLEFRIGDEVRVMLEGSGNEPSAMWRVFESLKRISSLSSNWNSYGAPIVSSDAIRRAVQYMHLILVSNAPDPDVIPTNDGGIQFEWNGLSATVELTIPPSAPISYLITIGAEKEIEGTGIPDKATIQRAFVTMS